MATILLSAAGAAIGGGFGGTFLGLSGAVIGRAVGATLGRVIDQRLLGLGAEPVEVGRIERFRLTGAGEGTALPQLWGRVRLGGQVIWASRFEETSHVSGGGKGSSRPATVEYEYRVSLAIALCEGPIAGLGRVWADGVELGREDIALRLYHGDEEQLPDPRIEAVEGAGAVPAYRGTAYVVIEDLALGRFGNRVPQFSFEVLRPAADAQDEEPGAQLRGVAMIPGTGEYALATTRVHYQKAPGQNESANVHSPSGQSDMATALDALGEELPNCASALLVVSWFGSDLRCAECQIEPKVEDAQFDGVGMPWVVSGRARADAPEIARRDGRPVYGGTPADASVVEAIAALRERGIGAVFYPFILMEQMAGNGLPDPWSDADDQPVLPWRGRITTAQAPGRPGTSDRSAGAEAEVAAFFGTAQPGDFAIHGGQVQYGGPDEWSYRRFILHYAWLCKLAGGVDAFCIGSEMRGLTQVRGAGDSFPAVAALRQLAADVRAILGPEVKLSYAADWSEYFGYSDGGGNRYFHLDPLWADDNIDFIGIDNYMPLSDWRDGEGHADAAWGSIYDLGYLQANIAGGEGFDWYYPSAAEADAQLRAPITDGAHGEPWVWRYKDLRGWWENAHHDRIDGLRSDLPSDWVPRSKPIWFTELGCPAVDKGTNQPNVFLDPKSSESLLPRYSNGRRDDLIQMQYLRAMFRYWRADANNPVSELYGGPMVDMDRAHVWAWDTRPWPHFPNNLGQWSDGENWARGHWINGRTLNQPLDRVVAEICAAAGLQDVDVSRLYGLVRGYSVPSVESGRAMLQPLMLALGFEAVERGGVLRFRMRDGRATGRIGRDGLVAQPEGAIETLRAPQAELAGRMRLSYIEAEADYEIRAAEAVFPDERGAAAAQTELPMVLTRSEARGVAERWLAEARVARDVARFALPPSAPHGVGDVLEFEGRSYRIDRAEHLGAIEVEAVRVEPGVYRPSDAVEERVMPRAFVPPVPVHPVFLDLPLMRGDEVPHAPHVAATARPWPGAVTVHASPMADAGYVLNVLLPARASIGVTEGPLPHAAAGRWDRGVPLRVRLAGGTLASVPPEALLAGANLMAIGDGAVWELFQFATAELMAPSVWELSLRLRGQFGTDGVMPQSWPEGSTVVLIDRRLRQLDLPPGLRRLVQHYRIGPAQRPHDDPAHVHQALAFDGVGLRPYAPVHLRHRQVDPGGAHLFSWLRRTRIEGDSWDATEVPLGEAREEYLLRIIKDGEIRREALCTGPEWSYGAAERDADGVAAPYQLAVAQVSERFGPGPFARLDMAQ